MMNQVVGMESILRLKPQRHSLSTFKHNTTITIILVLAVPFLKVRYDIRRGAYFESYIANFCLQANRVEGLDEVISSAIMTNKSEFVTSSGYKDARNYFQKPFVLSRIPESSIQPCETRCPWPT